MQLRNAPGRFRQKLNSASGERENPLAMPGRMGFACFWRLFSFFQGVKLAGLPIVIHPFYSDPPCFQAWPKLRWLSCHFGQLSLRNPRHWSRGAHEAGVEFRVGLEWMDSSGALASPRGF